MSGHPADKAGTSSGLTHQSQREPWKWFGPTRSRRVWLWVPHGDGSVGLILDEVQLRELRDQADNHLRALGVPADA